MNNIPTEFEELGSEAGRLGYHTIVLAYRNEAPIAAAPPVGCGNGVDPPAAPPNCAIDARMEILNGDGEVAHGEREPGERHREPAQQGARAPGRDLPQRGLGAVPRHRGTEPTPKWSQTVIAGGSLGAGQAAIIAAEHEVHRRC